MKRESVNNLVGTNALYGRARRIEFVERATYLVVGIISVILVFVIVGKTSSYNETNINFSYLREYLEARGFSCELIYKNGGVCTSNNPNGTSASFIRYDDGFQLIQKSDGYFLEISYTESKGDYIKLKTTAYALQGYLNNNYTCYYKSEPLDGVDYCEDSKGVKLDSNAYLGIIDKALYDLNNAINNSGYSKDKLLKNHEWKKK